jgi:ATP-dependent protease ClpP protease subunit
MNHYLLCEINDESLKELHDALYSGEDPFYLDISTDGGDSATMFAMFELLQIVPRNVIGTAIGRCQSAGVLVLAGCDIRRASANTIFMVHEDSYEIEGGHNETRKIVEQHEVEEILWAELMQSVTKIDANEWRNLSNNTTYFTTEYALSYGLLDEIVVKVSNKEFKRRNGNANEE